MWRDWGGEGRDEGKRLGGRGMTRENKGKGGVSWDGGGRWWLLLVVVVVRGTTSSMFFAGRAKLAQNWASQVRAPHRPPSPSSLCISHTYPVLSILFSPFSCPRNYYSFLWYPPQKALVWRGTDTTTHSLDLLIAQDQTYQLFHNKITLISTFIYIQKSYHHSFCVITSCTN